MKVVSHNHDQYNYLSHNEFQEPLMVLHEMTPLMWLIPFHVGKVTHTRINKLIPTKKEKPLGFIWKQLQMPILFYINK
jgi:hypothetical protein